MSYSTKVAWERGEQMTIVIAAELNNSESI